MEWLDVLDRIVAGERKGTEFKRGLDLSAVGRAVCAFANTSGGVVILGVTNGQEIVGVREGRGQRSGETDIIPPDRLQFTG